MVEWIWYGMWMCSLVFRSNRFATVHSCLTTTVCHQTALCSFVFQRQTGRRIFFLKKKFGEQLMKLSRKVGIWNVYSTVWMYDFERVSKRPPQPADRFPLSFYQNPTHQRVSAHIQHVYNAKNEFSYPESLFLHSPNEPVPPHNSTMKLISSNTAFLSKSDHLRPTLQLAGALKSLPNQFRALKDPSCLALSFSGPQARGREVLSILSQLYWWSRYYRYSPSCPGI